MPLIRANKRYHSPKSNRGERGLKEKIVGPILKVLGLGPMSQLMKTGKCIDT